LSGTRIHAYLRAGGANSELERVGPFVAAFTPGTDHPMLNYAIPDDRVRPSRPQVDALIEAFARRGRVPRLEYSQEAAPDLEARLTESGFRIEARFSVLGCHPGEEVAMPEPPDFVVGLAQSDRDHLDAVAAANEAFGELGLPDARALAARRSLVTAGGAVVLARDRSTGEPAGSGLFGAPRAGVSELAAVGTRVSSRNRGVAGSVSALLVRQAFTHGVEMLWLTPEHAQSERLYGRIGFRPVGGEMIHISLPVRTS
jgi:hypothetical protein